MVNDFNPKEGMQVIQRHQEQVEPAAEELRQRLNEIIFISRSIPFNFLWRLEKTLNV